jgi:hypothetical protein
MRVRFTRRADGRHRLTVLRDDGTASQGPMVPGLGPGAIPHDLLHALVEKTLGLGRGVYGRVNAGPEIAQLLDPAQRQADRAAVAAAREGVGVSEAELMQSEIVTTLLQSEAAYVGVDAADFRERLRAQCEEHGVPVPAIDEGKLGELRRLREEYRQRWAGLSPGATIEVEM